MKPKLVYTPEYNISLWGIEKLHVFDSCKYGRAWEKLENTFGISKLNDLTIKPTHPVENTLLSSVHSEDYLELLSSSRHIMKVLHMPLMGWFLPIGVLEKHVLKPMRMAVTGTVIAAEQALDHGAAANFSGGYHHASRDNGGGFCIYSDIAIAISKLKLANKITNNDQIIIIDLDAHQGNGLERIFYEDNNVHFLDMYNQNAYPNDKFAKKRIDCDIPLSSGALDDEYLYKLRKYLPAFLQKIHKPKIAFYNAGTDIYEGDRLGGLRISEQGIFERDKFVFDSLANANIPWVMVPSGGYSKMSHQFITNSIVYLLRTWA